MWLFKALINSKKLQVSIANIILLILNQKLELNIPSETMLEIVWISCAYILWQWFADLWKEANK
jgi:hypothetical protein